MSAVIIAGDDPISRFVAKTPAFVREEIEAKKASRNCDDIYAMCDVDGTWSVSPANESDLMTALGCGIDTALHCLEKHSKRPNGSSSAVIRLSGEMYGAVQFYYGHFTVNFHTGVPFNTVDGLNEKKGAVRKAFYRQRIDVSYNTNDPGIVGVINLRFSVLARECIDNMPDDLFCPDGDKQLELALSLIEQAKDATVKAVILTNKTAPSQVKQ